MQVDGINSYVLSVRRAVQKLSKPIRCSEAPMKRKTDDCTALRSSASLISSAPHRHQTCRAEKFIAAHFPDKSAQSAAIHKRCSLRSRADREFTRLPGPYSQAYIQTQHHLRTSRHLSRAISPSPSHRKQQPLPYSLPSHQQTHPYTTFHCRCPAYPQRAVSNSLPSPH